MRSRVLAIFLLVLLVIPALVTACGTSSDGTTTQTTTTTTTTPPTTTTTTATIPYEEGLAYPEVKRITAEELLQMMETQQSGVDFVVVDVRDPGSYANSHIERACNIYYTAVGDPAEFEFSLVPLPWDKPVILYCAWPDDEVSAHVALIMTENVGFDPELVMALRGGWGAWLEIEGPVASGATLGDTAASDVSTSPIVATIDTLSTCQSG